MHSALGCWGLGPLGIGSCLRRVRSEDEVHCLVADSLVDKLRRGLPLRHQLLEGPVCGAS